MAESATLYSVFCTGGLHAICCCGSGLNTPFVGLVRRSPSSLNDTRFCNFFFVPVSDVAATAVPSAARSTSAVTVKQGEC